MTSGIAVERRHLKDAGSQALFNHVLQPADSWPVSCFSHSSQEGYSTGTWAAIVRRCKSYSALAAWQWLNAQEIHELPDEGQRGSLGAVEGRMEAQRCRMY